MKLLRTKIQFFSQSMKQWINQWFNANPMQLWAKETVRDTLEVAFIPSVAYRVNVWPSLQEEFRTASNYRVLSTMYVEAVTWEWLVSSLGGSLSNTAALLRHLEALGALQIVKVHYALSEKTLAQCIDEQLRAHNSSAPRTPQSA